MRAHSNIIYGCYFQFYYHFNAIPDFRQSRGRPCKAESVQRVALPPAPRTEFPETRGKSTVANSDSFVNNTRTLDSELITTDEMRIRRLYRGIRATRKIRWHARDTGTESESEGKCEHCTHADDFLVDVSSRISCVIRRACFVLLLLLFLHQASKIMFFDFPYKRIKKI